jgi:hypothetical protein
MSFTAPVRRKETHLNVIIIACNGKGTAWVRRPEEPAKILWAPELPASREKKTDGLKHARRGKNAMG